MALGFTPPYIHPLSKPQPNAGGRQAAIAHHMGAPKQRAKAPQRPSGGVPKHKGGGGGGQARLGSSQKAIGDLNPGDIHNRAVTTARLERNAALAPLQTQATQIGANEQGVQQRYGQLVGAQNTQLEGIQHGQEASAKTFQNQAAENALAQGKAIETAGQTQASQTGGYTSPELRAQMALSSQQAAGQGGAGSAFAQNVAAGGAAEIAQMRGAASLNALGGSQAVSNAFQKQLSANQAAQQGVISKVGPRIGELEEKIGQANFSDKAVGAKFANEGIKLNQAGAKIKQTGALGRARLRTTERGQNLTRESALEGHRISKENSERSARIKAQVTKASKGKKTAGGTPATANALNKLSSELGEAYQGFVVGRSGKEKLTPAEIRKNLTVGKEGKKAYPKATNQLLITAAQELYYTHKVSKKTRELLGHLGMNIGYDNEAFHAVSGK